MENNVILVPPHVENMQLPAPELLNFYKALEDRVYWLSDEINTFTLELIQYILRWNKEDIGKPVEERKPIKILFFCNGGDLEVYRSIADIISLSQTPIYGIVIGTAYSAAGMIFLSCHKRFMLRSSVVLFHRGSGQISGGFNEVYAAMTEYHAQVEEMIEEVSQRTNYTREECEERMTTDWYVRADEALEHGVCDKIITNIEEIL